MERRVLIMVEEVVCKVMGFVDKGLKELLLIELVYGCILVEDLVVDYDVLLFNCLLYDGFVIWVEDINLVSYEMLIVFEVVGEIGVGLLFYEKVGLF